MNTRQLQHVQALVLQLQIGAWSGDKRRMEIAATVVGSILTVRIKHFFSDSYVLTVMN